MVVTVAAFKSGGKSCTSIHLAHFLNKDAKTCIVDADDRNRSALDWSQHGKLETPVFEMGSIEGDFDHVVIDTGAGLSDDGLLELANGCDVLVMPSFADMLNLRVLIKALEVLKSLNVPYKVLLTNIPPKPSKDGQIAKDVLNTLGIPTFDQTIRRSIWLGRASLEGVTVNKLGTSAKGAYRDYENVYEELKHYV